MHFVFVMDPVETVLADEDTSFALMLAAQERGHRVDHCLPRDLFVAGGRLYASTRQAGMQRDPARPITLGTRHELSLHEVDAVLVRKDPPFDSEYLWLTLMLEWVRGETVVANDPRALRDANEKLYACHFPELMPPTLIDSDKTRIKDFVRAQGGEAIIKPLEGAGGEGVMSLREGDVNLNAIIEAATRNGRRVVMVQRYLPEVRQGDKRLLLLDGEPLGAIVRVPQLDDVRSNIHVGGRVERGQLDDADRRIVERLAPRLVADGLWFVGLDVIGGKLTEVNVTSPTGIQQMSRFDGRDHSATVIGWLENRRPEGRRF